MRICVSNGLSVRYHGRFPPMLSCASSVNGFSKYSERAVAQDAIARIRHPGSKRAFRDIHVPKLLSFERNIKKISFTSQGSFESIGGNLPGHFTEASFDRQIESGN